MLEKNQEFIANSIETLKLKNNLLREKKKRIKYGLNLISKKMYLAPTLCLYLKNYDKIG